MFFCLFYSLLSTYYRQFLAKGNPPVHLCTSQQNMLSSFTALCLFQTGKKSAKVTVHENECYLYLARLQISTWVGKKL